MKRVLITGANSYIGTSVENYLAQWPKGYQVVTADMIDGSWRQMDFTGFDSVFHVAGIAHISTKKLDAAARERYWAVNALLPGEVAGKAKAAGVRQFIFLSSMSVYGEHGSIKKPVIITEQTQPAPKDIYGESKLAAEKAVLALQADDFAVCVLRPPMIYGPGCKGNYQTLVKGALKLPVFPDIKNERSMLRNDTLCAYVKELLDRNARGLFFPQDAHYTCTSRMVEQIALDHGRRIHLTGLFNPILRLLSGKAGVVDKVFGGLVYERGMAGSPDAGQGGAV